MTVTHGMNADEVEALGKALQTHGDQIRTILGEVGTRVDSTIWVGPDADTFKTEWWPDHRSRLEKAAGDIDGFGQSALNNASEQRDASNVNGGENTGIGANVGIGSTIGNGEIGTGGGRALPPGEGAGAVPGWFKPHGNPEYAYQCVDWAVKRRQNLGLSAVSENGYAMAGANGGSTSTPPSFGAIASYGGPSDNGHVMIVEEVLDGGTRIRVSEMNFDYSGSPTGFSSNNYLELRGGQWFKYGNKSVGPVTFAT